MLDNAGSFRALPLDELDETIIASLGLENPGARTRGNRGRTHHVPGRAVGFESIEGNASPRNQQVPRQRMSQKIPIAIVVRPVSCPIPRPTRSLMPDARPAKYPAAA